MAGREEDEERTVDSAVGRDGVGGEPTAAAEAEPTHARGNGTNRIRGGLRSGGKASRLIDAAPFTAEGQDAFDAAVATEWRNSPCASPLKGRSPISIRLGGK
jgi:hypothetical protein